jgi:catechol 2,3-dioxygenase-like lactoylglutathione lyase family enzyme
MTGGLLGALAGEDWLPREWFSVQDRDYLRHIANKLAARVTPAEGAISRNVSTKELEELTDALVAGSRDDLDFGGVRRVRVIDVNALIPSSRTTIVHGWKLQASDGQTIYITKVGRRSKEEATAAKETHTAASKSTALRAGGRPEARAAGVKLSVANLDASATFYEGVLGLAAMKRTPRFVSFGALSLVDARYAVELSGGAVALDSSVGRNRIEIHVDDLNTIHDEMVHHNVRIVHGIAVMPWGDRSLHCLDPDGNVVELVERNS